MISPFLYGIGWSVTSGDFNGDGLSDAVASNSYRGVVLYYGNNEIPTTPDQILTDPGGENGGFYVASAGDVNNDGFDDLIAATAWGIEKVYLYMGTPQGLDSSPVKTLTPPDGYGGFGHGIATRLSSNDINGDGFSDIIIGGAYPGYFCVYYGSQSGIAENPNLVITLSEPDTGYVNLSIIGDVNHDGFDDVAVSALDIYVYQGSASGLILEPQVISVPPSDIHGNCNVASAGDLNDDGFADLLVGCQMIDDQYEAEGKAYVYYGSAVGFSDSPNTIIDNPHPEYNVRFGAAVMGIRDFNLDGFDDIAIGCPYGNFAAIYYGSAEGVADQPALIFSKPSSSYFGWSVSYVGDMKGNGQNFIIIGEEFGNAYLYAHNDTDADGVFDLEDNCLYGYNPTQEDGDGDGRGDVCDEDYDSDGILDVNDNCPSAPNGPILGACYSWPVIEVCTTQSDCGVEGSCSMNQEDSYPPGGNGCGDACECHADCNDDQNVDLSDLVIMKQQFIWDCTQHPSCEADCNYDNKVDLSDLVMMKGEFLRSDCPICQ